MARTMMMITGEVSGDLYGSLLAAEITSVDADVRISGIGGDRMREAGVETFLDSNDLSVVGFWEAIVRLRKLRSALSQAKETIRQRKPDVLILIDYPGMNLRLAGFAKERGIKVLYYVSPQVWAWGRNRLKAIRKNVDKMAVILPFEVDLYEKEGIDVTYVGHPLIDIVKTGLDQEAFLSKMGLGGNGNLVALMPGSRTQEIKQHIQPLIRTASLLREQLPSVRFILVSLPTFREMLEKEIEKAGVPISVTTDYRYEALRYSRLAIACSGTATLEAALLGTPMIVIYRLALFSWLLGKLIVDVPFISLANLVAGEEVVPEFVQSAVNPKTLADEAVKMLTDDVRRRKIIRQLETVRQSLGPGGATARTARLALSLMSR
ncbi:MAG: lipid-A-disaccharide synthase [Candidatus Eisenbacteria bacterium]